MVKVMFHISMAHSSDIEKKKTPIPPFTHSAPSFGKDDHTNARTSCRNNNDTVEAFHLNYLVTAFL